MEIDINGEVFEDQRVELMGVLIEQWGLFRRIARERKGTDIGNMAQALIKPTMTEITQIKRELEDERNKYQGC